MPQQVPTRPSPRTHRFDQVPVPSISRSVFVKPSAHKTTLNSGYVVPLFLDEVLPGDTVSMTGNFFGRLQSLGFPILDNMYFDTFWFFCPNRILWENWTKFLGAQDNPQDTIDYTVPIIDLQGDPPYVAVHSLLDYFGLPIGQSLDGIDISVFPYRMYNKIFDDWFRDQNLQQSISGSLGDGPDQIDMSGEFNGLFRRGKRHDYVTSVLPWPQKGDAVQLPLGDTAPVVGDGFAMGLWDGTVNYGLYAHSDETVRASNGSDSLAVGSNPVVNNPAVSEVLGLNTQASKSHVFADLSEAVAATVNQMREAITIQQILERDARMGTRYTERIWGQFGVVVPDFTAQRPEYLGGSIDRVGVMQVAQTTPDPTTPTQSDSKGSLAAYSQIQARSGFTRSFTEHGWIMCLGSLRADISYQERIDKMWSRQTRYDFFDPALAHLGEQAVLNQEVRYFGSATGDDAPGAVFGYQERWSEMRSKMSQITGKFRSAASGTLDSWHLSLEFDEPVSLNAAFIEDNPPISRVLSVQDEPECMMDCFFNMRHVRPMPVRSVPGLDRL